VATLSAQIIQHEDVLFLPKEDFIRELGINFAVDHSHTSFFAKCFLLHSVLSRLREDESDFVRTFSKKESR